MQLKDIKIHEVVKVYVLPLQRYMGIMGIRVKQDYYLEAIKRMFIAVARLTSIFYPL